MQTLEVRESAIPGERGLFWIGGKVTVPSNKLRGKGPLLHVFEGEMRPPGWEEEGNEYVISTKNFVLDQGDPDNSSLGRYGNDCTRDAKGKGYCKYNNAKMYTEKNKVVLRATRTINTGDELFYSYGVGYWKEDIESKRQKKIEETKKRKEEETTKRKEETKKRKDEETTKRKEEEKKLRETKKWISHVIPKVTELVIAGAKRLMEGQKGERKQSNFGLGGSDKSEKIIEEGEGYYHQKKRQREVEVIDLTLDSDDDEWDYESHIRGRQMKKRFR